MLIEYRKHFLWWKMYPRNQEVREVYVGIMMSSVFGTCITCHYKKLNLCDLIVTQIVYYSQQILFSMDFCVIWLLFLAQYNLAGNQVFNFSKNIFFIYKIRFPNQIFLHAAAFYFFYNNIQHFNKLRKLNAFYYKWLSLYRALMFHWFLSGKQKYCNLDE